MQSWLGGSGGGRSPLTGLRAYDTEMSLSLNRSVVGHGFAAGGHLSVLVLFVPTTDRWAATVPPVTDSCRTPVSKLGLGVGVSKGPEAEIEPRWVVGIRRSTSR